MLAVCFITSPRVRVKVKRTSKKPLPRRITPACAGVKPYPHIGHSTIVGSPTPPVEGATKASIICVMLGIFQSTPPVEGATVACCPVWCIVLISIHAPCGGGDRASIQRSATTTTFQSTPHVERATAALLPAAADCLFQSTPPVQGATATQIVQTTSTNISIHAPCAGGDFARAAWKHCSHGDFNPRPLCRGRRVLRGVLRA